jgi:hypothetical protein
MPRARRQDDPTRGKPLTIQALKEYGAFEGFTAPGSFDPAAAWTHTYRIWLVGGGRDRDRGSLRIARGAPVNGSLALDVALTVKQAAGTTQDTKAKVECRADPLCTPVSWEIASVLLDGDGQPIEATKMEQRAAVGSKGIEVTTGDVTSLRRVPRPFTSNWSLFDAVQRLPGEQTKPLEFALLEDLELVKKGQRLSFREQIEFDFGGGAQTLRGYHQIGEGILPYHYWVDEHGRLLVAISGVRAYILGSVE